MIFAKSFSELAEFPLQRAKLLCCDLMGELLNTDTEIIDRDIGLYSVVNFDLMYVTFYVPSLQLAGLLTFSVVLNVKLRLLKCVLALVT